MTTAGSFLSAGALGYVIGVGMGTFQKGALKQGFPKVLKVVHTKGTEQGQ